ncbi:orc1 [Nucleospora cyclopteri]
MLKIPRKRSSAAKKKKKTNLIINKKEQNDLNVKEDVFTVKCREKEYQQIKSAINTFISNKNGSILYISGVPGSGKTHCVQLLIKEHSNNNDLIISYINAAYLKTKTEIYSAILSKFPCYSSLNKKSLQELRAHVMGSCKKAHLVVIDEIDFLMSKNQRILYNLFELPQLENSKVMLILLSNTLGSMSSKVESRIGENRLEFQPYTAKEIESILNDSKNTGECDFKEKNELKSNVTTFIAKKVASATGDIRKAKDLLQKNSRNIKEAREDMKDYFGSLVGRFVILLNFYQKSILKTIILSKNRHILKIYTDFKNSCKINQIQEIGFYDFIDNVEDLEEFGFIKIKNKTAVIKNFINEEIEDKIFN